MTAMGLSLVGTVLVSCGFGMDPSMTTISIAWACVLIPSIVVYVWRRIVVWSGAKDLIIDDESKVLSLPHTFGRKTDVIIPGKSIRKVNVKSVIHQNRNKTNYTYRPRIIWKDQGADQESELIEWSDQSRAQEFVEWLKQRIKPLRS